MKFVIVMLDGLRPDQLNEAVTPNLAELSKIGLRLARHTSSFPSETRVSSAALATGGHSAAHGIIGNRFVANGRSIDGSSLSELLTLGGESGGVLTATTIGEVLAAHGRAMLSIGSQSQGSFGLSSWGSWQAGAPAFWVHDPSMFGGNAAVRRIAPSFPMLPPDERPARATIERVVDLFFSFLKKEALPEVSLLWLSEPDITYHMFGLQHPRAREVLHEVDRQFGRIFAWWNEKGEREGVQLIAASDHGHAIIGEKVSVLKHLRRSGFKVGYELTPDVDAAITAQRAVNIWARDREGHLLTELYHAMCEEPWFGVAFSRQAPDGSPIVASTLALSAVMAEHERSADLSFVLADCGAANRSGSRDAVYYDGTYPIGVGMHGGLSAHELSSLCILAGDAFRRGVVAAPTSIVDLVPTILSSLGLPLPSTLHGRIIDEALQDREDRSQYNVEDASVSIASSTRRSTVFRELYRQRLYLRGAAVTRLAQVKNDKAGANPRN
ncbi:alkaline phosphatase family protein [Bradyrhizobium sp. SEMIA]|uniref:alkaline phosphatase family protein n=1 Tax=Bradyrhizobium sp. SEMIA TaxID=2597515 RepID=UPI0018A4C21F|nr:alkaline phosphatase family protein [Bradyrhizobium sp. SEMIA]QOG21053.1 type I phosphodiesterase/nucleotide pyrophosphatase [Bradyrhizobium sp. SEMIA]